MHPRIRLQLPLAATLLLLLLSGVIAGPAHADSAYTVALCGYNAAGGQGGGWSDLNPGPSALSLCYLTDASGGTQSAGATDNDIYTAPPSEAITAATEAYAHYWTSHTSADEDWSVGLGWDISGNNAVYFGQFGDCSTNASSHIYTYSGANSLTTGCNNSITSASLGGQWAYNIGLIAVCHASSCPSNGSSGASLAGLLVNLDDPYNAPSIAASGPLWNNANGNWISGLNTGASLPLYYSAYDPGTVCTLAAELVDGNGNAVASSTASSPTNWNGGTWADGQPCISNPSGSLDPNLAALATGTYYLNVYAKNPGNIQNGGASWASGGTWTQGPALRVDNSPPTGTVTSSTNSNDWYGSAQTVTVNASDLGSGLDDVNCVGPGAPTTAIPASELPYLITVSQDGSDTITCDATDNAGNIASIGSTTINIDHQQAPVSFSGLSQSTWYGNAQQLHVTASETNALSGVQSISCVDNGGSPTAYQGASADVPVSTNGVNQISCTSTTNAGVTSDAGTYTVLIDKTAPTISFTGAPAAPGWTNGTAKIAVSASDSVDADNITGLTCTSNGADPQNSTSGTLNLQTNQSGATTFSCVATNAAGTTSDATNETVQIDNTVPSVTLSGSSDPATWVSGTQQVTTHADAEGAPSGIASTSCKLNGENHWTTSNDDSQQFPVTASGTDTIICYSTTNAGVQSPTASYTLKVDNQHPTVAFTGTPAAPDWTSDQATITATGSEAQSLSGIASVTCAIGDAQSITTPGSVANPALSTATSGDTNVACYATSNTGIQGPTATQTYRDDSVLPQVTFSGPAQTAWETGAQNIQVSAQQTPQVSGVASITCQTGSEHPTTTTNSSTTVAVNAAGTTTISCYATSNSGAVGPAATYTVNLDDSAPTTTISGPAQAPSWVSGPQTLLATGSDPGGSSPIASISCRVDSSTTQAATADHQTISVTADGSHTVTCISTNAAGVQSAPASRTVQISSENPTISFQDTPSSSAWYSTTQSMRLVASAGGDASITKIICTQHGQSSNYPNTSSQPGETTTVQVTAPGGQLSCVAQDAAGNVSDAATTTVQIDDAPPVGHIQPAADSPANELVADLSDAGSGVASAAFQVQSADGSWQPIATTWDAASGQAVAALPASLAAGSYSVRIIATDAAGNAATITANQSGSPASVTVAAPAPATSLTAALLTLANAQKPTKTVCKQNAAVRARTSFRQRRHAGRCHTIRAASNTGTLTAAPVRYGASATLEGVLTAGGAPVAGQHLTITAQTPGTRRERSLGQVFTSASGAYQFTVPAGPSRKLAVNYAGTNTVLPASTTTQINVAGKAVLHAARRLTRARRLAVNLQVPDPTHGRVAARVYARDAAHAHYRLLGAIRTRPSGRGRALLKPAQHLLTVAGRLQLKVVVPAQISWPYATTAATASIRFSADRSHRGNP